MRSVFTASTATLLLAACAPAPPPPPAADIPLVRGYRAPADQCQLVGEDAFTNRFLDDAADLVGCPLGYEGTGVFVIETGALSLNVSYGGYALYTVPRR